MTITLFGVMREHQLAARLRVGDADRKVTEKREDEPTFFCLFPFLLLLLLGKVPTQY